VIFDLLVCEIP